MIYKEKDTQDPKKYQSIYVSMAVYSIPTQLLLLKRITQAMIPCLFTIQPQSNNGIVAGSACDLRQRVTHPQDTAGAYLGLVVFTF